MFFTVTASNDLLYIVTKLLVLAISVLVWWVVVSHSSSPVV